MYIMHDMDSGFGTYRKNKTDTSANQSGINEKYISVYNEAVELWRIELKVAQSEKTASHICMMP